MGVEMPDMERSDFPRDGFQHLGEMVSAWALSLIRGKVYQGFLEQQRAR